MHFFIHTYLTLTPTSLREIWYGWQIKKVDVDIQTMYVLKTVKTTEGHRGLQHRRIQARAHSYTPLRPPGGLSREYVLRIPSVS